MTQNIITAGDASNPIAIQGGNDGTVVIQSGLAGAKVNALSFAVDGTPTFLKGPVNVVAFSAYKSTGSQSLTSGVSTQITFDAKDFDTNNNFASSRFTPTVAGYYSVSASVSCSWAGATATIVPVFRKNGSDYSQLGQSNGIAAALYAPVISDLIYMNGSTDYLEVWIVITGTTPAVAGNVQRITKFSGILIAKA
jgi:hypothetical protein